MRVAMTVPIGVVICSMGGCPTTSPGGSGPVVVATDAFSVTLPDSAAPIDTDVGISGATFTATYRDKSGNVFLVYSVPIDQASGANTTELASIRFDGVGPTSSGDLVALMTMRGSGIDLCGAYGQTADGQFLFVMTNCSNPARVNLFASIDLAETDGTPLNETSKVGLPLLLNPPRNGVLVLDDDSAYRVTGSVELRLASAWKVGASIFTYEAGELGRSATEPFFLLEVGEWRSIPAAFLGTARRSTLVSAVGSSSVALVNGSTWSISSTDTPTAKLWKAGDAVAVVNDARSVRGFTLIHLASGDTVAVAPS